LHGRNPNRKQYRDFVTPDGERKQYNKHRLWTALPLELSTVWAVYLDNQTFDEMHRNKELDNWRHMTALERELTALRDYNRSLQDKTKQLETTQLESLLKKMKSDLLSSGYNRRIKLK
jgi:hypothetical protein